jgi:S1-C subfamily serine protease
MCRWLPTALLGLLVCSSPPQSRGDENGSLRDALALEATVQEAIRKAEPTVACLLISRNPGRVDFHDPKTVPESFGSGVVIGKNSNQRELILTNFHVVQGEHVQIYARFPNGKGTYARIKSGDSRSDLAVLELRDPVAVDPIPMGDADRVRKGQFVISIANPFAAGFRDGSPSASWGIISNIRRRPAKTAESELDRNTIPLAQYGTLLQIDARLNLGCSGGALVNLKGELIGLTTAQAALAGSETAGGFAVPMSEPVRRIIGEFKQGKRMEYGFLGVSFNAPSSRWGSEEFSRGHGVRIDGVIAGSPAAVAGLRPYDTILSVNGVGLRDSEDLFLAIGTLQAGTKAQLQVQGKVQPVTVTLAKYYFPGPSVATNDPPFVHGLRVDYTSVLMQRTGNHRGGEIVHGVYVSEVQPGSPGDTAQLQDAIITRVNGRTVNTPADFYREAAERPGPMELTLANGTKVKLE